ncbi:MAG: transposase [Chlamydiia bacterium]
MLPLYRNVYQIFLLKKPCNKSQLIDPLVKKVKAIFMTKILPKSKVSGSIGHFMGLEPYLKNYIANPYARPDNNIEERALKLVVIRRKNWVFVGNKGGGKPAVIY